VLEALELPFVQRGLVAVVVLAVGAGVLGTWIVLRGLAFFAHAVGTATFPGLVLAAGLGASPVLGGLGAAVVAAVLVQRLGGRETATALVLVAALALGVVLASDVFDLQGSVDGLLFGSLLSVGGDDVALAAAATALALLGSVVLGARWLATGFDPGAARAAGLRSPLPDLALLALVAVVALAALQLVGALLATALLVVPAATTRLLVDRLAAWRLATVALALALGAGGLLLAVEVNAPPGAAIAVLAGAAFLLAWLWRARRIAVVGVVALAGCGGGGAAAGDERVVAVTTPQLADLAKQVGGDVRVVPLLRPGADPHDYEPRPEDVQAVAKADVVLASGLGLDPWIDEVAEGAGGTRVLDVGAQVVGEDVGRPHEGEADHDEGGADPHWWQDPALLGQAADAVAAETGGDPSRFEAELQAAVEDARACLDRIHEADRTLVTDHDAFGRFAGAFGLEVVGAVIPSTTSQAQASAGAVAELARTVRERGVPAIFPEAGLNADLARTLAERTGAEVGPPLYADTLEADGPASTLVGALRANADAISRGLAGEGCG
jgi:ABC-type Zn uptake system ZnuABC Zn-binding protein ZnuA/ABC-type Mn2+/Zn2+ transport system permease subunit